MTMLKPKPPALIMPVFDRLPESVRRAIAEADFAYDPEWVAGRLERGKRASALVKEIRERTARRMARQAAVNSNGEIA